MVTSNPPLLAKGLIEIMYFNDLKLGMTVEIAPAVIEKQKMLDFAHTYDNIPLHTDEEYAKASVFEQLIAPGVMSFMSVWAKYLEVDFFGKELLAGKSTKIEWHKPVYANDVLHGTATITNLVQCSAKNGIAEITIEAYNQNGVHVLSNLTEAIVKCAEKEYRSMLGVLVNVITVIVGSLIGLLFKKGIPERVSKAAMIGLGACTVYIGISGSLCGENVLILIAAVVLGAISGTLLNIDGAINRLAESVENKFKKEGKKTSVAEGLVSSTLLFCVGSMTVTGSIQAGLTGDNSVLITKATLDLVSSMMLASSLGIGVLLSAGTVFVIQGGLALLAGVISPFMNTGAINEMTCAGSLLIIMIGTNLMGITKIKVADYLPAIVFAPIIYNIVALF